MENMGLCLLICILLQLVLIFDNESWDGVGIVGTGIWCGIPFGVTGILGIVGAKHGSRSV